MPKTCYYEILGVGSTANNDDLKKAYKKSALRWHPDKNIGDEDAHSKFLAVKEAFTVLSDPHERAWYDKHKDQILSDGTDEVNYFDVYPYFTATCFKGYNDSENGFYTVYRNVFENIAADDDAMTIQGKSDFSAPSFGTSESVYKDEVEPFYNYWSQYCTKLTFSWTDDKISRDYPRKVIRAIERSNQKKREKMQKERNEEVRNLVNFVRKRDKRVQAWRAEMEKEKNEKMQKSEELRREQLLKNKQLNESYQECEWAKFSALEDELENVEKSLKEHFQDENESEDNSENSDDEDQKVKGFFCLPCHKMFQSEKAFENHEGSKKHKQNVAALANKNK